MKIVKKHAVTLFEFIIDYLDNGYYPVDDDIDESALISKILGFGLHHGQCEPRLVDKWVKKRELPKSKKVARIELTSGEACAIMDMVGESIGKDIEDSSEIKSLRNYLNKEFILKEEK